MTQEKFEIYWQIVVDNELDYFKRHYATVYHRNM